MSYLIKGFCSNTVYLTILKNYQKACERINSNIIVYNTIFLFIASFYLLNKISSNKLSLKIHFN